MEIVVGFPDCTVSCKPDEDVFAELAGILLGALIQRNYARVATIPDEFDSGIFQVVERVKAGQQYHTLTVRTNKA